MLIENQLNSKKSIAIGMNTCIIHNKIHEAEFIETKESLKDQIIKINKKDGFSIQEIKEDIEGSVKRLYNIHFYNRFISISVPFAVSRKIRLPQERFIDVE